MSTDGVENLLGELARDRPPRRGPFPEEMYGVLTLERAKLEERKMLEERRMLSCDEVREHALRGTRDHIRHSLMLLPRAPQGGQQFPRFPAAPGAGELLELVQGDDHGNAQGLGQLLRQMEVDLQVLHVQTTVGEVQDVLLDFRRQFREAGR